MVRFKYLILFIFAILHSLVAFAGNELLLQKIVERAKESQSDSLVILQNGQVVYSDYFGTQDQTRSIQSVTKSIAALAIGILLDENKITSLDLPMSTWIPEWASEEQKATITLRMILNHTSGYPDTETVTDFFSRPDRVLVAKNTALIASPGSQYFYSSIATTLLQPVIAQASGQTVKEFIFERIFLKLKITDSYWNKDKAGHEMTAGGLFLSTEDLVKIGIMLLQNGSYDGQVVIQPQTLPMLVTKSQPYFSYGLLFWLYPSSNALSELFSAVGWGGQYVTVFPEKGLIAIRTKDPKTIVADQFQKQAFWEFPTLISQWE